MATIEEIISDSRFNLEPGQMSIFDGLKYMTDAHHKHGAIFTLFSLGSGQKFTYKINRNTDKNCTMWWLYLLTGPNNTSDYTYMGTIIYKYSPEFSCQKLQLVSTAATKMTADAPSWKAITAALKYFQYQPENMVPLLDKLKIYHDGHCSKCHKELTDIVSLAVGQGPICAPLAHAAYKAECKVRKIELPKKSKQTKLYETN